MNTLIPKVAAAIVSLGGAVAVLLETKGSNNEEDLLSQVTSLTEKPKKRVPNRNNCNIYLVDYDNEYRGPQGTVGTVTRKVKKFEEQFWTKDEFLQEIEKKNLWDKEELKRKVENACNSGGKNKAFVWWGKSDNNKENTWVFNDSINQKDWLSEGEQVDIPAHWQEEWNKHS
ncbi:hypothetical protein MHC_02980 [Mycoplasma haemocanis str. Illinois]|uniref:Uncharacterized protein n=1 Tax=Mycoplasma haemocanis (strain Illinois) TaxID=1111676 RepID=H6N736_MYCHN|nr:hypothetical protein [Mycoplasma haemocanis]AEW45458.1 hypothetical protein MHC_02980 [Mycoplasma haemocanis str. Illinois]